MLTRLLAFSLASFIFSCAGSGRSGTENGACYPNGTCNAGLSCLSAVCVNADAAPTLGAEGLRCYPNGTCDLGLACLSGLCVNPADAAPLHTDAGAPGMLDGGLVGIGDGGLDGGVPPGAGTPDAGATRPDYVVRDPLIVPALFQYFRGERFSVTFSIVNLAYPTRRSSSARVALVRGGVEAFSGSTEIPMLGMLEGYSAAVEIRVPFEQMPGTYAVRVTADSDDVIDELDESNNQVTTASAVVVLDGPVATSISELQSTAVASATCVRVGAVAMSTVFHDGDDTVPALDGGRVRLPAFYVSEVGLTTTAARTGIEVVISADQPVVSVGVGDDLKIIGIYAEKFGNSTIRFVAGCGGITRLGSRPIPVPAPVTITEIGQTGGSAGTCPGSGWVDGSRAEDFEGVLVRIDSGSVSEARGASSVFEVSSGVSRLQVSTDFGIVANPAVGASIGSEGLIGFGHFSFCRRKIRPRADSEISIIGP